MAKSLQQIVDCQQQNAFLDDANALHNDTAGLQDLQPCLESRRHHLLKGYVLDFGWSSLHFASTGAVTVGRVSFGRMSKPTLKYHTKYNNG